MVPEVISSLNAHAMVIEQSRTSINACDPRR